MFSLSHFDRSYLISLRLLGKIPQLVFLTDRGAANAAQVERLLSIADFGPEEASEDAKISSANEEGKDEEADVIATDDKLVSDAHTQESLFGIDHSDIQKQIQMHKEAEGQVEGEDLDKKSSVNDLAKNFKQFYKDIKKKKNRKSKSTIRREAKMYTAGELDEMDEAFDEVDQDELWDGDENGTDLDDEYSDHFDDYEDDYRSSRMDPNETDIKSR